MSEEIIKVLDNLGEKFGVAIDWTSSNVIPYLQDLGQRFIQYRNVTAIIQIILFLVLFIASIICIKKLIKWTHTEDYQKDYDNEVLFIVGVFFSIVLIILSTCFIIGNCVGIAQNIFIPEVTIINYIQNMI